jgi:hypothetical protein
MSFDAYLQGGLRGLAKEAKKNLASNPITSTSQKIALSSRGTLEQQLRYLERRLALIEEGLAKALNVDPAQLSALLDQELAAPEPRKTVDELAQETVPCTRCGRAVHRKLVKCQVCGTPVSIQPAPPGP